MYINMSHANMSEIGVTVHTRGPRKYMYINKSHTNRSGIGVTCTYTWPTLIYVHKHEPH